MEQRRSVIIASIIGVAIVAVALVYANSKSQETETVELKEGVTITIKPLDHTINSQGDVLEVLTGNRFNAPLPNILYTFEILAGSDGKVTSVVEPPKGTTDSKGMLTATVKAVENGEEDILVVKAYIYEQPSFKKPESEPKTFEYKYRTVFP